MQSCLGHAAALAGLTWVAASTPAQPVAEMELPSCVSGSPPLRVSADAARSMLDTSDRDRFQEAAQARYPLYQRGGTAPNQVLMLRNGSHWQYVTLQHGGPTGMCFSAVFVADRFDFTPAWLAKYKPRTVGPAD